MFGAQQSGQHGVGRHPHLLEYWLLEILPVQILNLRLQIIDLKQTATEMHPGKDIELESWYRRVVYLLVGLFNFELRVVSLLVHQINLLVKFPTQFLEMKNK